MTAFEEFGVMPEIARAVEEMEWTLPTDVQAEAIPMILGGGDVLMAAETGSGKTGAFCLPIIQITSETVNEAGTNKSSENLDNTTEWKMSVFDRDATLAITPNGLVCQTRDIKEWNGCRATFGVRGPGKYFYEAKVLDEGLCRVGWSTSNACRDLGTDNFGYGFGGTGKKSNNRNFDSYGEPFGMNDIIGCCLDFDNAQISFYKNGKDLGKAFELNENHKREDFFPAVVLKNAEISFNFGESEFKYSIPSGFTALSKAKKNIKKNLLDSPASGNVKPLPNAPKALIIEPSRELAEQTYNQIIKFKKYLKDPPIKILLLLGGVNVKEQIAELQNGIDIVVATPGRLEDLIRNGNLLLSHCKFFVLDEADGLLKQGYSDFIDRIHKLIPKVTNDGKRLQMIVCSATLHDFDVKKMAQRLMHFPTWIDLKGEDVVPETVHHCVCMIDPRSDTSWKNMNKCIRTDGVHNLNSLNINSQDQDVLSEATKILKGEYCKMAINEHKMDKAIIFCRTKLDCDNLENYLMQSDRQKYSCVCLHADRKPHERKMNLEKFKQQQVKFLICTDVAARGLDVTGLPYVINFLLPDDKSNYLHRIGRVGRAERMGLAISLVSVVPEKVWYHGEWCSSRGRNCNNTNLTTQGGCCIWYNEKNCLAEIEDHLNINIPQIDNEFKVPVNEFDGKVTYGKKSEGSGIVYEHHVSQLKPALQKLTEMELKSQSLFLNRIV